MSNKTTNNYKVIAYDKDNDVSDKIVELESIAIKDSMLRNQAMGLLSQISFLVKSERLKTMDGQPYDWVELQHNEQCIAVM